MIMTLKMIFVLLLLVVSIAGCIFHSIKAKRETGKAHWHNVYWTFVYALGVLIGFGFSLDYFEPAAPTMAELNNNPAWHNWLAGGLFALCAAFFTYSVYKAFKK